MGAVTGDDHGFEGQSTVGGELSLWPRGSARATLPVQLEGGHAALRDLNLGMAVRVIDRADLVLRVAPGLALPTGSPGGIHGGALSTGSVDPVLGVDLVLGGAWLGVFAGEIRAPIVAGSDGVRQGAYHRLDAQLGRRQGKAVFTAGASQLGGLPDDTGADAYNELAAVAGAVWAPWKRHAFTALVRVPVLYSGDRHDALQLGWTVVLGEGWEREDEHHDE